MRSEKHKVRRSMLDARSAPAGLRGPLSQFFSGIYLKLMDDAFNSMDVTYLRYQEA